MFCGHCRASIPDDSQFCTACGRPLNIATTGAQISVPPPPSPASAGTIASGVEAKTSGTAIASFILGLFGFLFPAAIAAIILGHISRSEIRKGAGRLKGAGLAMAGLVLGYLGILLIPVILIVAAIAIPNLLRARITANEASAVAGVRTIVTAEHSYANMYPEIGFTCDLSHLGGRGGDAAHAGLIEARLSGRAMTGYRFVLRNCSSTGFQVAAYPVKQNQTGRRAYCSDETGVIHYDAGGSAEACDASSPALE